jgi:hypothetical protein
MTLSSARSQDHKITRSQDHKITRSQDHKVGVDRAIKADFREVGAEISSTPPILAHLNTFPPNPGYLKLNRYQNFHKCLQDFISVDKISRKFRLVSKLFGPKMDGNLKTIMKFIHVNKFGTNFKTIS